MQVMQYRVPGVELVRQSNERLAQCLPPGTATSHVWNPENPKAGADAILAFLSAI